MGLLRFLPVALLVLGIALLAVGVLTGSARLYLVLFIPVIAGGSGWLAVGAASLFAGLLTLPLLFPSELSPESTVGARAQPPRIGQGSGGVVLPGPIPIFFGSWRRPPARAYWIAVVVGAALFAGVLLALVFLVV